MSEQENQTSVRSSSKSQTVKLYQETFQNKRTPFGDSVRPKMVKLTSIQPDALTRRDIFGTEIRKGGRVHKVTFVDKIPIKEEKVKIAQEIPIENYKEYNANNVYPERPFCKATDVACCESCITY